MNHVALSISGGITYL